MSHVLNAFVFDEFAGALVTGAQINGDGTGRMDFDLPEVDNERVRALEAPVNEVIARGLAVRTVYVDAGDADAVDRTGAQHVGRPATDARRSAPRSSTSRASTARRAAARTCRTPASRRRIRITKVENKGRHNRRVRFVFAE